MTRERLREIMDFVLKEYPNGCAASNWRNHEYIPKDFEIDQYLEDCFKEFIYEDLDLCGCGSPECTYKILQLVLQAHKLSHELENGYEAKKQILNNICGIDMNENSNYLGLIQFVEYILDSYEFMEHGSGIGGAWLTEKGKIFLEVLDTVLKEEEKEE